MESVYRVDLKRGDPDPGLLDGDDGGGEGAAKRESACVALIDHGKGLREGNLVRVEGGEYHHNKRTETSMDATWRSPCRVAYRPPLTRLFGPYRVSQKCADTPNKACQIFNSRLSRPPERPSLFHPRSHNPLQDC